MNSLFSEEHANEIILRLEKLTPDHNPIWGKMNPAQMMAHCSAALEVARDQKHLKRMFIGYILGPMIKKVFYNDKPLRKNSPTHPDFVRTEEADLENERQLLTDHVRAFQTGGPEKCTTLPHTFFGKLSPEQWSKGMYKHLDYHLQQFGV